MKRISFLGVSSKRSCRSSQSHSAEVRNRFKGLHLIDRVPDELWTEVRDIVQEVVIKIFSKKEMQKGKIVF